MSDPQKTLNKYLQDRNEWVSGWIDALMEKIKSFKNRNLVFWDRLQNCWASLVAQRLKCLPAMWETGVQSLGWEDALEKEMTTHSSIIAWRIPWVEEPGGSMGSQRVGYNWVTSLSLSLSELLHKRTHLLVCPCVYNQVLDWQWVNVSQ